jgi:hypothetical protein
VEGLTAFVGVAIVIGLAVVIVLLLAPADVVLLFLLDRGVARVLFLLVMTLAPETRVGKVGRDVRLKGRGKGEEAQDQGSDGGRDLHVVRLLGGWG